MNLIENEEELTSEQAWRLFNYSAEVTTLSSFDKSNVTKYYEMQIDQIIENIEIRNTGYFEEEIEKQKSWKKKEI